jgi:hypothetical protein
MRGSGPVSDEPTARPKVVGQVGSDDSFLVGDETGVEGLGSTLRRLSRVVANNRFFYRHPARA